MKKLEFLLFLVLLMLSLTGCINEDFSRITVFDRNATIENLSNIKDSGVDLTRKQLVDFHISVSDEKNGKKIENKLTDLGFICRTSKDFDGNFWTTECSKEMLLDLDLLMEAQELIDRQARKHNGFLDGWGVLVKPDSEITGVNQ
ncbi:ribonuclease E inhibitor RraB [Paenibacillus tarimensis]